MYQEKPLGLFVKYALPQMIGLLLNSVYLIVDGMFIGNRLGRDAMAAAAVAVPVVEILIALSLAIAVGAGIIISSGFGMGDGEKANRAFNLSLVLAIAVSIVVAILGNLFLFPLARALGATPDILDSATTYLWYIVTGSPFLILSFAFSAYARADDRPKLAMWALVVGSAANIILDYLFMYPLNMGIAGAALATAIGPVLSVGILLPHFICGSGRLRFAVPVFTMKTALRILVLGAPAFIMEFSIGIVTLFYNIAIIRFGFGELGLAAYLTIGYIALIILTLFLGLAQGVQPLFSYFHGKGDVVRGRELAGFLIRAIVVMGVGMSVGVVLFSRGFIGVFSPGDEELITFTYERSVVYFSGFVFAGVSILVITWFQSVERVGVGLGLALLRSVVLVPVFLFLLPGVFGGGVIWWVLSGVEVVVGGVAILVYWRDGGGVELPLSEGVVQKG